jgi:hypothetical protein
MEEEIITVRRWWSRVLVHLRKGGMRERRRLN